MQLQGSCGDVVSYPGNHSKGGAEKLVSTVEREGERTREEYYGNKNYMAVIHSCAT